MTGTKTFDIGIYNSWGYIFLLHSSTATAVVSELSIRGVEFEL